MNRNPALEDIQLEMSAAAIASIAWLFASTNWAGWSFAQMTGMVRLGGVEPPTSGSTIQRSNQLSYNRTEQLQMLRGHIRSLRGFGKGGPGSNHKKTGPKDPVFQFQAITCH